MLKRKFKDYRNIKQQTNELLEIMTKNQLLVMLNDFEKLLRSGNTDYNIN